LLAELAVAEVLHPTFTEEVVVVVPDLGLAH
jgi:hypothetical protein